MRGLTGGRERRGEGLGRRKELIQTRNAVTCWTAWVVGEREARLVAHMQQALGRSWDVRQDGSRLRTPGLHGRSSRDTRQLTATSVGSCSSLQLITTLGGTCRACRACPACRRLTRTHALSHSHSLSPICLVAERGRATSCRLPTPPPSPKVKRPRRFCHEVPDVALVHSSDD